VVSRSVSELGHPSRDGDPRGARQDTQSRWMLAWGKSTMRAFAGATATSGYACHPACFEEELLSNRDRAHGRATLPIRCVCKIARGCHARKKRRSGKRRGTFLSSFDFKDLVYEEAGRWAFRFRKAEPCVTWILQCEKDRAQSWPHVKRSGSNPLCHCSLDLG
jgi:hypothetical protein